jgi:hypothetical protein
MRLVMKKMIMIAIIAATLVTIYMMKNKEEQMTQPATAVEATPAAEEVKTEAAAPVEQPAPAVEEVKTEEAAPAEQPAPSVEATPAAEEAPATEEVK